MKFIKKRIDYSRYNYQCKKDNFNFTIDTHNKNIFYVCAYHLKVDIRYNSLWEKLTFDSFDSAVEFCENFNYINHKCIGDNI